MDFENFTEIIWFELALEGIGTVCTLHLLWHIFFHNGLSSLFTLFITSIC